MDNGIWNKVLEILKEQTSPESYDYWFKAITLKKMDGPNVILEVPDKIFADWIIDNYKASIQKAFGSVIGSRVDILIEVSPSSVKNPRQAGNRARKQARNKSGSPVAAKLPNPDKTFSNFVVGSCNEFAYTASRAVADFPGSQNNNPLFIYGGTGLGKTHLMHALGNQVLQNEISSGVVYITAEQFMNEMINALRYKRMVDFRERYRQNVDVLLMDDIQFLGGKERTQEEFFHTFEAIQTVGKQIVIAADMLPKNIEGLENRLRSRCEGGLLADLQAPDLETMLAILESKAEQLGLNLPSDVGLFIAQSVDDNIRELEGALNRLSAITSFYKKPLNLETTKKYLKHLLPTERKILTPDQIIKAVARFHDIKPSEIRSSSRLKRLVKPRHIAIFLIRENTDLSFPDIGVAVGNRDHATIQYAYRKIEKKIREDNSLATVVQAIQNNLPR